MKKIINSIKRALASIPSQKTVANIMLHTHVDQNGALRLEDGTKIGSLDPSTGIGWCSLPGYIRLCRSIRKSSAA